MRVVRACSAAASEAGEESARLTPRPEAVPTLPLISAEIVLLTLLSAIGTKCARDVVRTPAVPKGAGAHSWKRGLARSAAHGA